MRLFVLVAILVSSASVISETLSEKDKSLIHEMNMNEELVSKPQPLNLLNAASEDSLQNHQSRVLKVLLKDKGTAQAIAQEVGVTLISSNKQKAASFKVGNNVVMDDIINALRSHEGVVKVKREVVINKYDPK